MKGRFLTALAVVGVACLAFAGINYLEDYDKIFYTKIDNSKVQELSSGDMKFEYTLDCFDENAKKKELTFKTYKELREDAYLMLEVRLLGVHKWQEVQFDELPEKVQEKIE